MQRLKLVGLVVFLVVGLSFACYVVVRHDFAPRLENALAEDIVKAQSHFRALKYAQSKRLVQVADWLAQHTELNFLKGLRESDLESRHREIFAAISAVKALLQKAKRIDYLPDAVLVTDRTGKVLARDRFVNEWGTTLKYPLLTQVLEERVRDKDVWKYREQNVRMMTAVAAPILDGAQAAGALVLLYEHNHQMALEDRKTFSTEQHFHPEIAYYAGKSDLVVFGSSLSDGPALQQLRAFLQPRAHDLEQGKIGAPQPLEVGGRKFLALAAPFDDNASNKRSGYVILGSVDDAIAPVQGFLARLPFIAAGFLLVAVILGLLVLRSVTSPYDRIEQGVLEVVSGNIDHRFDAQLPGGAGSLSHALNLLVAHLLGQPPPDRDPEDTGWTDPFFVQNLEPAELRMQAVAAHRSDLNSDLGLSLAYYEKLFMDYIAARARVGVATSERITLSDFVDKVRKNENALREKYNCPVVKFEVTLKDGKVTLKPIPIR